MVIKLFDDINVSCYRVVISITPGEKRPVNTLLPGITLPPARRPGRWQMWQACHVTARSPQRGEAGWFTAPAQLNHRRYEALRAVFLDGRSQKEVADHFGYRYSTLRQLVYEFRRHGLDGDEASPFFAS